MEKIINKLTSIRNACKLTSVSNLDDAIDNLKEIKTLCSTQINKCLSLDEILELNTCKKVKEFEMQKIHSRLLKHFFNNDNFVIVNIEKYNNYRKTGFYNADFIKYRLPNSIINSIKEENTDNILECMVNSKKKKGEKIRIYASIIKKHIQIQYGYDGVVCVLVDKSTLLEDDSKKIDIFRHRYLKEFDYRHNTGCFDPSVKETNYFSHKSPTKYKNEFNSVAKTFKELKESYDRLELIDETYLARENYKLKMNKILEDAKIYPTLSESLNLYCNLNLNVEDFKADDNFINNSSHSAFLRRMISKQSKFNVLKDDEILDYFKENKIVIESILGNNIEHEVNKNIIKLLDSNLKTKYGKLTFMMKLSNAVELKRSDSIKRAINLLNQSRG